MLGNRLSLWSIVFLLLASCQWSNPNRQTTLTPSELAVKDGQRLGVISRARYTIFYHQGDHLQALIEAKRYHDAARLYDEQHHFFDQHDHEFSEDLKQLVAAFHHATAPVSKALTQLKMGSATEWLDLRQRFRRAQTVLDHYPKYRLLREKPFAPMPVQQLQALLKEERAVWRDRAIDHFLRYALFSKDSFFFTYPIDLDRARLFSAVLSQLKHAFSIRPERDLIHFAKVYAQDLPDHINHQLSNIYMRRLLDGAFPADHSEYKFSEILNAHKPQPLALLRKLTRLGFKPTEPSVRIGIIEATSQTLLKRGLIDFPIKVDVDLPVKADKARIQNIFTQDKNAFPYLLVIEVAQARTTRHVTRARKSYPFLQEFDQPDIPMPEDAEKEDVVRRIKVRARKNLTLFYYLIDLQQKHYFKSSLDLVEKKSFHFAPAQAEKHPSMPKTTLFLPKERRGSSTQQQGVWDHHDDERDALLWEDAPVAIKLSQLVDHYLGSKDRVQRIPNQEMLYEMIVQDKNRALDRVTLNDYQQPPIEDSRFKSVVRIDTQDRVLGSGFYITPNVIMTNWHVVEEANYVELFHSDQQKSLGRVFARDVRLDIALIRTAQQGLPVQFYPHTRLKLGETVEALGHPVGYNFSVSRGVVSALRRLPSINLKKSYWRRKEKRSGGGKDVLLIQTDAAINGGNSGGPLFLENWVIGMNTWSRVRQGDHLLHGLNFAVHYAELITFAKAHLSAFTARKAPKGVTP
ncbi:S1C family serine protease [Magnetococcales bacterium HHB-1]